MRDLSVYIHIPFCRRRCPYCDFVVQVDAQPQVGPYLDGCLSELRHRLMKLDRRNYRLVTIYFGGGTPSLVPALLLESFLDSIRSEFAGSFPIEITIECNPEDHHIDFNILRRAGITRLSLGTQSILDEKLLLLGRMHRHVDIEMFIENARAANFDNISCDLIFGTPGETVQQLERDLDGLLALSPTHISAYELTIERGTNFFERIHDKKLELPMERAVEDQMLFLDQKLALAGFEHYEISNYAKSGFYSLHNSAYWQQKEYIGLGIGAHSFIGNNRSANTSSMREFTSAIGKGQLALSFSDQLTAEQCAHELLLLGFRNKMGINLDSWRESFGTELLQLCATVLTRSIAEGFCTHTGNLLVPTLKGMMVADSLAAECMNQLS